MSVCGLTIAGISVAVETEDSGLTEKLRLRYEDFPLIGDPQLIARINWTNLGRRQPTPAPETVFDGDQLAFKTPGFSGLIDVNRLCACLDLISTSPVEDVDYFLRLAYSLLVFSRKGIMFHAAGIVRNGAAYLFFGHSGSGKTTVARLSTGAKVLNDDLVVLLPDSEKWKVFSTPFWNPDQVRPSIGSAPLAGLYRLVQDRNVYTEAMRPAQALAEFVASVPVIPTSPRLNRVLVERGLSLLASIPACRLHFLPDASFWQVVEA